MSTLRLTTALDDLRDAISSLPSSVPEAPIHRASFLSTPLEDDNGGSSITPQVVNTLLGIAFPPRRPRIDPRSITRGKKGVELVFRLLEKGVERGDEGGTNDLLELLWWIQEVKAAVWRCLDSETSRASDEDARRLSHKASEQRSSSGAPALEQAMRDVSLTPLVASPTPVPALPRPAQTLPSPPGSPSGALNFAPTLEDFLGLAVPPPAASGSGPPSSSISRSGSAIDPAPPHAFAPGPSSSTYSDLCSTTYERNATPGPSNSVNADGFSPPRFVLPTRPAAPSRPSSQCSSSSTTSSASLSTLSFAQPPPSATYAATNPIGLTSSTDQVQHVATRKRPAERGTDKTRTVQKKKVKFDLSAVARSVTPQVKPYANFNVGDAVLVWWGSVEGTWPAVVMNPFVEGKWFRSLVRPLKQPWNGTDILVKSVPAGGDWFYADPKHVQLLSTATNVPTSPTSQNVEWNDENEQLFTKGLKIARSEEKLKAWSKMVTNLEKAMRKNTPKEFAKMVEKDQKQERVCVAHACQGTCYVYIET
ncbi:hypothetical protein MNV49_002964 [Pseudohyphozyma bogoriensis]|nr:hypothetical protein MNV49_002964 [Pseudohyphozyma bogoriensis]